MNYNKYSIIFKQEANNQGLSEDEIEVYLTYAKVLLDKSLPIIYNQDHLSKLLGIHPIYLYTLTNSSDKFYRKFKINKKNGKKRNIEEPLSILKEAQYWILEHILLKCSCSNYTKAFKANSSIKENAKFHKKQNIVINLDIEDYFGTIKGHKVYEFFRTLGYNNEVSIMLTKICTNKDSLPQGSPTSPYLSNIITENLDNKLAELAKKEEYGLRYTRYADDITFSTNNKINITNLIIDTKYVLKQEGFKINYKKTKVISSNKRQMVTGIVVNDKLQVSKQQRRKVRQAMYYIEKYDLESHIRNIGWQKGKDKYLRHLLGNINFVLFINPKDKEHLKYKSQLIQKLKEI
ncbi:retron St85 family RNA-directed DNA polymerase [Paraclostridium sordellii]|uniref:retron St85 family RNA-directed DNA polymerase n=1 Tax=Paraclostridium sordellii TaxID=1505 RepID=UPI0005DECEF4|nr:retron St85 family RNA-directed DNA polymerase [Paeniclostridium sordellii]CEN85132.1 RNA-directed DNA polymerase [[Clostridium] sordellii] [Paeniclostridium sordellii]